MVDGKLGNGKLGNIYTARGTVQAGNGIYLSRQADRQLLGLCEAGTFAYVLTSRQMGKSSLMVETARRLAQLGQGIVPIILDLTDIGAQNITPEGWYQGFVLEVAEKLEEQGIFLETDVYDWWQDQAQWTMTQRLMRFFQQVILVEVPGQVVMFIDEIDTTLGLGFTDDFFIAIRSFYTSRAQRPVFKRLSFVLIGVATPNELIKDAKRTPFNIGERIDLTDFTPAEALPLAEGLGLEPELAELALAQILAWTGGHPYLTQRLCLDLRHALLASGPASEDGWVHSSQGKPTSDLSSKGKPTPSPSQEGNKTADFSLEGHNALHPSGSPSEEGWWVSPSEDQIKELLALSLERLTASGQQDEHFKFVRDMLLKRSPDVVAVLQTYRQVWQGKRPVLDEEKSIIQAHLKLSGIVMLGQRQLRVRNRIYNRVFDEQWLRDHWPETWWQQIQPALPLIRASLLVTVVMSGLGWVAWQQAQEAETLAEAEYQATVAKLREQAAMVQNWLPTRKATRALVMAIQTYDQSQTYAQGSTEDQDAIVVVESSLLSAVQQAKGANLFNHDTKVLSVAFSPNGEHIVSGSGDGALRLWDLQGNQVSEPFVGHTNPVRSVAFSPSGERIVSGSYDGTLRLWDSQGNQISEPFAGHTKGHTNLVFSVAFSPDGERIVSGGYDGTLRLWDLAGNPIGEPFEGHGDWVWSVAFSPDGERIISGSDDGTLRLWDLAGNPIGQAFKGHNSRVFSVAFSPDGERIVSSGADSTLRLWDLAGNPIGEPFEGHGDWVWSVAFSPDGEHIVSGSRDGTVRLWDLADNQIGQAFGGHGNLVLSVAFSPKFERIVSGSDDGSLRLWDFQGNQIGQTSKRHSGRILSVAFSPDGERIVSGSDDSTLRLWNLQGNQIGQAFEGHRSRVLSVAFSPNGEHLVSSSDDTLRLWDLQGNQIGEPFEGYTNLAWPVAFSPNGKHLVSSSGDDGTLRLWDLVGNQIGESFGDYPNLVLAVAFSLDGERIASGSYDGTVKLWDLQGNQIGEPFEGHSNPVLSVAFSPNGKRIVSGSDDGTLRLWDLAGNQIGEPFQDDIQKRDPPEFWLWQGHPVAFSPDGKYIVSGRWDGTLRLWHASPDGWLTLGCNRLRHHPYLRTPATAFPTNDDMRQIAEQARDACERRVWSVGGSNE
jgi:WD40 repeat protein